MGVLHHNAVKYLKDWVQLGSPMATLIGNSSLAANFGRKYFLPCLFLNCPNTPSQHAAEISKDLAITKGIPSYIQ